MNKGDNDKLTTVLAKVFADKESTNSEKLSL